MNNQQFKTFKTTSDFEDETKERTKEERIAMECPER
jgi:hypothetical protein